MVCNGLGLFIACSDDVDSVTIPSSTPICGYSRGVFTEYNIIDSDKTVLYRFTNINQGVLFEKKVIRLIDVIHIMMDRYTISTLDQADSMLLGHIVTVATETYSKDDDYEVIVPDENYKNNYFIPDHYINNNIEDNSSSNDDNSNDSSMVYNDTDTTSDIIQTIVDDNRDDVDGIHDDDDNDIDAGSDSVVVKAFDINATNIGNVSMIVIKNLLSPHSVFY